jgi:CBS domain containing-hemolysin-like protein
MTLVAALLLALLLALVALAETLYEESMRLLRREGAALELFRKEIEPRLGLATERGALCFSLLKHTLLVASALSLTLFAASQDEPLWLAALESFAGAWVLMLISAHILPQVLLRRAACGWLPALAPLLGALALPMRPVAALLETFAASFAGAPQGGEEIEALIAAGEEEGIIEKSDSKLIQNVIAFGDKQVREVMTPRRDIVAIEASRSVADLHQLVLSEKFSRIPVYEGTLDQMAGFVHVHDLHAISEANRAATAVRAIMRPIAAVPEMLPVSRLVEEMRSGGRHMAYVVGEYGSVVGLVTLEDLMEEIVGEIRDEHEPGRDILEEEDGAVVVSGSFDLDHLRDLFDFRPPADLEAATVAGLVTEWAGAVPAPGAVVEGPGLRLEVLAADGRRVERVRIRKAETPKENQ